MLDQESRSPHGLGHLFDGHARFGEFASLSFLMLDQRLNENIATNFRNWHARLPSVSARPSVRQLSGMATSGALARPITPPLERRADIVN